MKAVISLLSLVVCLSAASVAQTAMQSAADDGHFTVLHGGHKEFSIGVTAPMKGVTLSGTFKATGGNQNAIIVLVMTAAQFANWKNHKCSPCTPNNGGALYNSGQVSQGTINLSVADGAADYFVVFNNTHFQYAKDIESDLTWQWSQ
jgi:hypothetical protein